MCWYSAVTSVLGIEAGRVLWIQGQYDLYSKFQDSHNYTVRSCLKDRKCGADSWTQAQTQKRWISDQIKESRERSPDSIPGSQPAEANSPADNSALMAALFCSSHQPGVLCSQGLSSPMEMVKEKKERAWHGIPSLQNKSALLIKYLQGTEPERKLLLCQVIQI